MAAYVAEAGGRLTTEGVIEAFIGPRIDLSMTNDEGWKNDFRLVAAVNNTPAWGGETMPRLRPRGAPAGGPPDARHSRGRDPRPLVARPVPHRLDDAGALRDGGRDQLSDGLRRSTDMAALRGRLFADCAAGIEAVVRRRRPDRGRGCERLPARRGCMRERQETVNQHSPPTSPDAHPGALAWAFADGLQPVIGVSAHG
jgi:hypothetical protein